MAESYAHWVSRLQARLAQLHRESPGLDLQTLIKEKDSCGSFLQRLYDHAEQYDIDLVPSYHQFADIQFRLQRLEAHIRARKQAPDPVHSVEHALSLLAARLTMRGCLAHLFQRFRGARTGSLQSNTAIQPRRRPYE